MKQLTTSAMTANTVPSSRAPSEHDDRIGLQRCSEIGRRSGASARNSREQVAAVLLHHGAQLRRAGDATGRGERLGDLVRA